MNTVEAKVLIAFTDKETNKKYKVGDTIKLTAKRFNEITRKGRYVELVEVAETKKETK